MGIPRRRGGVSSPTLAAGVDRFPALLASCFFAPLPPASDRNTAQFKMHRKLMKAKEQAFSNRNTTVISRFALASPQSNSPGGDFSSRTD